MISALEPYLFGSQIWGRKRSQNSSPKAQEEPMGMLDLVETLTTKNLVKTQAQRPSLGGVRKAMLATRLMDLVPADGEKVL
jgi:hypothetical protein